MPHRACVLSTTLAMLALTGAAAADGTHAIARHGNWLLVTAPDSGSDPTVAARMQQRVTVDFQDTPLDDAVAFLRTASGLTIVVAPGARVSAAPITLKVVDMSLSNVVEWIRQITKLHVGHVHGALFFSDQPIAGPSTIRLYDVSDLVMTTPDFPGPELAFTAGNGQKPGGGLFGPTPPASPTSSTPDEITDLIKKHVKPEVWGK